LSYKVHKVARSNFVISFLQLSHFSHLHHNSSKCAGIDELSLSATTSRGEGKFFAIQKLYLAGEWSEPCDNMNSHPLHSLAVQTTCKRCLKQQTKLDGTMSRLKLVMKELNESLSRLKNEEKTEGGEVLPDIDEGLQEPASPVKEE